MGIVIAIPAYNEELVIEKNVNTVVDFCRQKFGEDEIKIVVADNSSNDDTGKIVTNLSLQNKHVEYLFVDRKGKGVAISTTWKKYDGDIYVFMDADLATDLSALPVLIDEIKNGADISIGNRFHKKSRVRRSIFRKCISWNYRLFLKVLFKTKINDLPCGFKAVNKKVRDKILPKITEEGFFWDTEMLILASRRGFNIKEIPVVWSEYVDPGRDSKVSIVLTIIDYIKKSISLRKRV